MNIKDLDEVLHLTQALHGLSDTCSHLHLATEQENRITLSIYLPKRQKEKCVEIKTSLTKEECRILHELFVSKHDRIKHELEALGMKFDEKNSSNNN